MKLLGCSNARTDGLQMVKAIAVEQHLTTFHTSNMPTQSTSYGLIDAAQTANIRI